jgi:hypothetical protein
MNGIFANRPQCRALIRLLLAAALNAGCGHSASPIPNIVGEVEYSVYASWLAHHFKEQPSSLLLADRTFIFDPIGALTCSAKNMETHGHVDPSLLQALHSLGKAMYPVETAKFQLPQFRIPWKYQGSIGLSANPTSPFRLVTFSRVAFNRDRTEGLFAVSNSCGGLCGGGGALLATRESGSWTFRSIAGCSWIY